MTIIAIDAGHGYNTAGKRTPILPNNQVVPETGRRYMNEFVFNHAVATYLVAELKACGFTTVLTYKTTEDTPLSTRVAIANNSKADAFISIHANASKGVWGSWGGIETFYSKGSASGLKLATAVHNSVMNGNPITRDRKLKTNPLYVVSNTKMPAILLELGFMDSTVDYIFLLQDSYRKFCATQIAKGLCSYFGRAYKSPTQVASKPVVTPVNKPTTQLLEVLSDNLHTYRTPNWNDKSGPLVHKGDVYTVVETLTVNGSKMYKLKSGLYITANTKHVRLK